MPRYPDIEAGQWVYPQMSGYKMACRDCGLVHRFDFEIDDDGVTIRFRAFRDNRATAAMRRVKA